MARYWVGAYGVGVGLLDAGEELRSEGFAGTTPDPSYLLRSPDRPHLLYAVDEGGDAVVLLEADADGRLAPVARVPTAGSAPCHLAVVAHGTLLLASCYGDGVVSAHPLDAFGRPGPGAALPAPPPAPTGPHPAQDGPHAHAALELDALLLVADLGTDRVLVHRREEEGYPYDSAIALPAGAGPRDLLALDDTTVLVLGEHDAAVHVLDLPERAVRASVPVTAEPGPGDQAAAMTLTGDLLTVGLRGSDRIAVLRLGEDGVPVPVGAASCGGTWPRHHVVDGGRVLVANERSGTITAIPLDPDGGLGEVAAEAALPKPTFLLPLP